MKYLKISRLKRGYHKHLDKRNLKVKEKNIRLGSDLSTHRLQKAVEQYPLSFEGERLWPKNLHSAKFQFTFDSKEIHFSHSRTHLVCSFCYSHAPFQGEEINRRPALAAERWIKVKGHEWASQSRKGSAARGQHSAIKLFINNCDYDYKIEFRWKDYGKKIKH